MLEEKNNKIISAGFMLQKNQLLKMKKKGEEIKGLLIKLLKEVLPVALNYRVFPKIKL